LLDIMLYHIGWCVLRKPAETCLSTLSLFNLPEEAGAWDINGPSCDWEDINTGTCSFRLEVGRKADDLVL
jgi:hypothetical protein